MEASIILTFGWWYDSLWYIYRQKWLDE